MFYENYLTCLPTRQTGIENHDKACSYSITMVISESSIDDQAIS